MATNPGANTGSVKFKPAKKDSHNIVRDKYYVFNETGNIMIATTVEDSEQIEQDVRDVFNEVSVFFAAMTKALASTPIPGTNEFYDIYHYEAVEKIVDTSGLFVQVQEESIYHTLDTVSAHFSEELLLGVIGLGVDTSLVSFAKSMVSSMGKAGLKLGGGHEKGTSEVSNIIFVCEYLLGMPIVTTLVIHVDSKEVHDYVKIGPCFGFSSTSTSMTINKDSYMFVLPDYIKKYSPDLISGEDDPAFQELVSNLINALVSGNPTFSGVAKGVQNVKKLEFGSNYNLLINNFGLVSQAKIESITLGENTFQASGDAVLLDEEYSIYSLPFTAHASTPKPVTTDSAITVKYKDLKGNDQVVTSPPDYQINTGT